MCSDVGSRNDTDDVDVDQQPCLPLVLDVDRLSVALVAEVKAGGVDIEGFHHVGVALDVPAQVGKGRDAGRADVARLDHVVPQEVDRGRDQLELDLQYAAVKNFK